MELCKNKHPRWKYGNMLWYIYHLSHGEKGLKDAITYTCEPITQFKKQSFIHTCEAPQNHSAVAGSPHPSTLAQSYQCSSPEVCFPWVSLYLFILSLDTYWNDTNHCLVDSWALNKWYTILIQAQLPFFNLIFVRFNHIDRYSCSSFICHFHLVIHCMNIIHFI